MKKNSFIIIILSIFIFTKANAELIKPSSNIEPYKVVKIQLSSLMKNNYHWILLGVAAGIVIYMIDKYIF